MYLFCSLTCIPSGTPGHYTATISGYTVNKEAGNCQLYMHLNGQQIEETLFQSGYADGAWSRDQGSRTMVSHTIHTTTKTKVFFSDLPYERR